MKNLQETSKEGLQKQLNNCPNNNGKILPSILYYLMRVPANDYVMKDISKEDYQMLQDCEPMMYRKSYEEYRKGFLENELKIKELNSKDHFSIEKIFVDKDNVEETIKIIEEKENFYGWNISDLKLFL